LTIVSVIDSEFTISLIPTTLAETNLVESLTDLGDAMRVRIGARSVLEDSALGASISVNGICLTVAERGPQWFEADVMAETLKRTSLSELNAGSAVNLERAARVDSRLGGHIVQGHVDGTGAVSSIEPSDQWTAMAITVSSKLTDYMVEKGSITVDGVSLTIVSVIDSEFTISLIPTTLAETNLGTKQVGERVNIEVDVLAKYVEKLVRR
jgi:riboflavin synthase